jgi:hypothetical protein
MRTGGFPCRLIGCLRVFQVVDQNSMTALAEASAARTTHEIADHDYHHVRLADEHAYMPHPRSRQKPAGSTP